jgi:hypothetical protein
VPPLEVDPQRRLEIVLMPGQISGDFVRGGPSITVSTI